MTERCTCCCPSGTGVRRCTIRTGDVVEAEREREDYLLYRQLDRREGQVCESVNATAPCFSLIDLYNKFQDERYGQIIRSRVDFLLRRANGRSAVNGRAATHGQRSSVDMLEMEANTRFVRFMDHVLNGAGNKLKRWPRRSLHTR